jgi:hypothetical protein
MDLNLFRGIFVTDGTPFFSLGSLVSRFRSYLWDHWYRGFGGIEFRSYLWDHWYRGFGDIEDSLYHGFVGIFKHWLMLCILRTSRKTVNLPLLNGCSRGPFH